MALAPKPSLKERRRVEFLAVALDLSTSPFSSLPVAPHQAQRGSEREKERQRNPCHVKSLCDDALEPAMAVKEDAVRSVLP